MLPVQCTYCTVDDPLKAVRSFGPTVLSRDKMAFIPTGPKQQTTTTTTTTTTTYLQKSFEGVHKLPFYDEKYQVVRTYIVETMWYIDRH